MISVKAAPPSGTYFSVAKKRVALQLPNPSKDYEVKPILDAAEAGDVAGMAAAWNLDETAISLTNSRGHNVFHILARFGLLEPLKGLFELRRVEPRSIARELFDKSCRDQDKNKQRVLHLCVEWPETTDLFLTKIFGRKGGAAINGYDYKLRTPLHRAVLLGAIESVEMLLDAGAEVDLADVDGRTPLHLACYKGFEEIAALLLDHQGALLKEARRVAVALEEKKKRESSGGGFMSRKKKHKDDSDSDDDDDGGGGGEDAEADINPASEAEGVALLRFVNKKDKGNQTPLHLASRNGHNDVISVLVARGANLYGAFGADTRNALQGGGLASPSLLVLVAGGHPRVPVYSPKPKAEAAKAAVFGGFGHLGSPGDRSGNEPASPMSPMSPMRGGGGGAALTPMSPMTPGSPSLRRLGSNASHGSQTKSQREPNSPNSGASVGSTGSLAASAAKKATKGLSRFQPMEEAVKGGHMSTVKLLRSLGAGTSMLGASLVVHNPCGDQPHRDDGVCEKCLFRLQWQAGHRRTESDTPSGGASVVTILPFEERSWRSTVAPHYAPDKGGTVTQRPLSP